MEQIVEAIATPAFFWGAILGFSLMGWISVFGMQAYKRTLLLCAQGKTAEKLADGQFYYIVSEQEYGELTRLQLRVQQNQLGIERSKHEDSVVLQLQDKLHEMRDRKDQAYLERNRVVAALARLFPSGRATTAIEGWSPEWHGCVYIDLPTGQVSWHFHDSQAFLFEDLPPYTKPWDGHTTPEKYRRLAALATAAEQPHRAHGA